MSEGWRQAGRDPVASNQLGCGWPPGTEATSIPQLAGTLPLAGWDDHILGLPWPFEYRLE